MSRRGPPSTTSAPSARDLRKQDSNESLSSSLSSSSASRAPRPPGPERSTTPPSVPHYAASTVSSAAASRRTTDEAIRRNIEMELQSRRRKSANVGGGGGGASRAGSTVGSSGLPVMGGGGGGGGARSRPGSEVGAYPHGVGSPGRAGSAVGAPGGGGAGSVIGAQGTMSPTRMTRGPPRPKRGTVAAMNPTPAVALHESARVVEAAAHMAAKRVDAVLIVDAQGHLSGIITDKDMTFRVVAEGLDPRTTLVSDVMTHNPVSVITTGSAADALNKMVAGHFRHLPVIDEGHPDDPDANSGGVVAVLDITKCLYDALEKLDRLYESARHRLDQPHGSSSAYASMIREHLAFPDLASLLNGSSASSNLGNEPPPPPPVVALGDSVLEAARRMRAGRETAALVFDAASAVEGEGAGGEESAGLGDLAGIFTSKDLVLRVLAAGLDPATTPVVRVMTPHPDCVTPDTPVIDALKKMHAGRYLHLPVVDPSGVVEGLVDVLKLTYTVLGQLSTMQVDAVDGGSGALWNRFWESTGPGSSVHGSAVDGSDGDSDLSGDPRQHHHHHHAAGSAVGGRRQSSLLSGNGGRQRSTIDGLRNVTSPIPSNDSLPDDSTVLPEDSASRVAAAVSEVPVHMMHHPPAPPQHHHHHHPVQRQAAGPGSAIGVGGRGGAPGSAVGSRAGVGVAGGSMDESACDPGADAYTFKLRDLDTGKIHRLVVHPPSSLEALTKAVLARLGPSHPRFPHPPTERLSLSYIDDEGDTVHLASDEDLAEAVAMARGAGWNRLMLCMDAQVVAVGIGRFLGGGGGGSIVSSSSGGYVGNRAESDAGSVDVGAGAVVVQQPHPLATGGQVVGPAPAKRGRKADMEILAPVLVGTGIAVVCAFLLGRAFR
ncbi:hypothetical protein HDU96_011072 [Phlyctochytrium bullatum]|nr:hypothetical protein HDU96_011072 [Phlyctochytrium bullatum]